MSQELKSQQEELKTKELPHIELPTHNPSDLVHGILCEHVKHESGNAPAEGLKPYFDKESKIEFENRPIIQVTSLKEFIFGGTKVYEYDFIYTAFTRKLKKIDSTAKEDVGQIFVENLMANWRVDQIFSHQSSSYFGVLYRNDTDR